MFSITPTFCLGFLFFGFFLLVVFLLLNVILNPKKKNGNLVKIVLTETVLKEAFHSGPN